MKKKPEVLAKAKIQLGRQIGPVLTPGLESPDWVNSPIAGKALYTVHMRPRLKLKSRWATENNIRRSRDTGFDQDACLARSSNAPANSALYNCVARAIVPGKELAVHGPLNPSGATADRRALSR